MILFRVALSSSCCYNLIFQPNLSRETRSSLPGSSRRWRWVEQGNLQRLCGPRPSLEGARAETAPGDSRLETDSLPLPARAALPLPLLPPLRAGRARRRGCRRRGAGGCRPLPALRGTAPAAPAPGQRWSCPESCHVCGLYNTLIATAVQQ